MQREVVIDKLKSVKSKYQQDGFNIIALFGSYATNSQNNSSDIADHMKVFKKKCIIRDLGLNLEASENRKILGIIQKMQLKRINKEDAFSQIKAELPNSEEYNDAEIRLKIGNQAKNVKWNDFEHIMGNYDITQKLYEGYRATQNFAEVLIELADEYYQKIIESEVI